ncbi:MAG TPA: damage-inducible protein DinB [Janthinobacterium sp.]|nr:damage-inducible protein DinB [Janthinobacterium sp.]
MSSSDFMGTMLAYRAWANRELFAVLEALPEDVDATLRHTMVRVLNHVYVVDRIFQAHLQGVPHGYTALNTAATPELGRLSLDVGEIDEWYARYASAIDAPALAETLEFRFIDGAPGRMTRAEILFHVVNHGSYHRGAVGAMLTQVRGNPPKDVITNFLLAHARKAASL